ELLSTPQAVARVSHYRLAAHLGSAFLLYAGMLLTGLNIVQDAKIASGTFPKAVIETLSNPTLRKFRLCTIGLAGLIFFDLYVSQNFFQVFIQKLAIAVYGEIFFDNPTTVQFDHRVLAMTTLSSIVALWLYSRRLNLPPQARLAINGVLGVGCLQVTLGISTLLYMVPIPLASAHQAGSLTLLTTALYLVHIMRRMPIKL
ncbi:14332_t:CDS:2, partial [Acaulospora morrowiae]